MAASTFIQEEADEFSMEESKLNIGGEKGEEKRAKSY